MVVSFFSVACSAMAQVDTAGIKIITKDSVATRNIIPRKYMPSTSLNSYLFLGGDSMQLNKSKSIFFPYRYVQGKYNNANIFNVTGVLLLGFIGYKTDHTYYYKPDH